MLHRRSLIPRVLVFALSTSLLACGDKDDDEDDDDSSSSAAVAECDALCAHQATGDACESGYVAECQDFCPLVFARVDAECEAAALAWFACGQSVEWTCVDSFIEFNGYPQPMQVDDQECEAEIDTFNEICFGTTSDSGR
jgi:hypothetical protein